MEEIQVLLTLTQSKARVVGVVSMLSSAKSSLSLPLFSSSCLNSLLLMYNHFEVVKTCDDRQKDTHLSDHQSNLRFVRVSVFNQGSPGNLEKKERERTRC